MAAARARLSLALRGPACAMLMHQMHFTLEGLLKNSQMSGTIARTANKTVRALRCTHLCGGPGPGLVAWQLPQAQEGGHRQAAQVLGDRSQRHLLNKLRPSRQRTAPAPFFQCASICWTIAGLD